MKDQIHIQFPKSIIVTNQEQPSRDYKTSKPSILSLLWPHSKSWPISANTFILVLVNTQVLKKIILPYVVLSWALLLFIHSLKETGNSFPLLLPKTTLLPWFLPAINCKQNNNQCAEISGVIRSNRKKKFAKACFYYKGIKIQCTFKVEISHHQRR